jgi:UDP-glucose 4-epimerase
VNASVGEVNKVMITGGSGFIGRNLVEQFAGRYDLVAPSHRELDLTDGDAVRAYLRANRPDVIVHSATKPGHRNAADPTGLVEAATKMFFNLAADVDLCPRMVFLSTGAVYDMRHYSPRMSEDYFDVHIPPDETGFSKYVVAKYTERVDHVVELRPFGVFGKYEDYAIRFISNAICKTLFDLPVSLRQNRRFSYIWIDDLVKVVEHFMTRDVCLPAYNVTPDETNELLELAELVVEISGKNLPVVVAESGLGSEYTGANARLKAEMPGLRFMPTRDAVERLFAWYYEHRDSIDRSLLLVDR